MFAVEIKKGSREEEDRKNEEQERGMRSLQTSSF